MPSRPLHAEATNEEARLLPAGPARSTDLSGDLRTQLGTDFHVARYGEIFLASDLPIVQFRGKVATTLLLCQRALQADYFQTDLRQPVVVYAFRDRESYTRHLRALWNEAPISPYGHYNYLRRHVVFNAQTGLGTMVHELTHALMDTEMPFAPIWFAEGLASLYEQCRIEGKRILGVHNWRLPELKRKLDTPAFTGLSLLLRMDDQSFKAKESLHYAEARYLCMYLEEKGLLRKFYRLYRDGFDEDPTGRRTLERVCGRPLFAIEREWKVWVRSLAPSSQKVVAQPRRKGTKTG
jgi:hypothetical protein